MRSPRAPSSPLIAEYNYATGDRGDGAADLRHLYHPHGKYGLTDQVGWRNIHDLRAGLESKPRPAWTINANYRNWWRASARDGLYNSGGTLVVAAGGTTARHIGQEIALDAAWALTKQTQLGAGLGHLFPGAFLKQATTGRAYTYPYLLVNYTSKGSGTGVVACRKRPRILTPIPTHPPTPNSAIVTLWILNWAGLLLVAWAASCRAASRSRRNSCATGPGRRPGCATPFSA